MTGSRDARLHLIKAEEFLQAAEANHGMGFFSAAANAVDEPPFEALADGGGHPHL